MNTATSFLRSAYRECAFFLDWRFWRDSFIAIPSLTWQTLSGLKYWEQVLVAISAAFLVTSYAGILPAFMGPLELTASIAYAWSTWLLVKKDVLGWYLGNVGVILFIIIFLEVQLYGEVIIMIYFLITDMIGINNWLNGVENDPPPHQFMPSWRFALVMLAMIPMTLGLTWFLIQIRGAAPAADALTTVFSMVANILLAKNYVQSWYLWVAADVIYVPLYLSRGLIPTAVLYVGLLFLATTGLVIAWRSARGETSASVGVEALHVPT